MIAGLLVAVKQLTPDTEVTILQVFKLRAKVRPRFLRSQHLALFGPPLEIAPSRKGPGIRLSLRAWCHDGSQKGFQRLPCNPQFFLSSSNSWKPFCSTLRGCTWPQPASPASS